MTGLARALGDDFPLQLGRVHLLLELRPAHVGPQLVRRDQGVRGPAAAEYPGLDRDRRAGQDDRQPGPDQDLPAAAAPAGPAPGPRRPGWPGRLGWLGTPAGSWRDLVLVPIMVPRRLPQSSPAAGPPARGRLVPGPGIGRRLAGGRPGSRTAGAPAGGLPVCGPPLVTVRSRARNEARRAATARADRLGRRPPGGDGAGAGPAVGGRAGRGAHPVRGADGGCLTRAEVSADHLRHLPASPGVVGSPAMAAGTDALRGAVPDGRFRPGPGPGPAFGFRFGPVTASARGADVQPVPGGSAASRRGRVASRGAGSRAGSSRPRPGSCR